MTTIQVTGSNETQKPVVTPAPAAPASNPQQNQGAPKSPSDKPSEQQK